MIKLWGLAHKALFYAIFRVASLQLYCLMYRLRVFLGYNKIEVNLIHLSITKNMAQIMRQNKDDAQLIQEYQTTNNTEIRDDIVIRYIPLVHFVLGRLGLSKSMGPEYEDAASQGIIGLIESVDRFNYDYGTQFSTYATLRIRGKVIDYLRALDWLPRGARKRARLVQEAIDDLWEVHHRHPTDEEIAEYIDMPPGKVRQALIDYSHVVVSLDTNPSIYEDEEASFHELVADDSQVDPFELIEDADQKTLVIRSIHELPDRDQLILSLYYNDGLTFKEIGAVLDISESRVCQLHGRIVAKLKSTLDATTQFPNNSAKTAATKNGTLTTRKIFARELKQLPISV